jgi:DNA polymerase-3 subunit gamma/tau
VQFRAPALEPPVLAPAAPSAQPELANTVAQSLPVAPPVNDVALPAALAGLTASNWATLLTQLPLAGMARSLAMHALPRAVEGERLLLDLAPAHASLASGAATERLASALAAHFCVPVEVSLRSAEPAGETPAARESRLLEERRADAVLRIEQDANVRLLLDTFAGRLLRDSIRPVDEALTPAVGGQ